jgi:galactoside 2-L-fucosyltransferase 1/2
VWSIAKLLNRTAFVPATMLRYLGHIFVNLTIPALETVEHCDLNLGTPLKRYQLKPFSSVPTWYRKRHILLHKWIILLEPVLKLIQNLRKEFHFQPYILKHVAETFNSFKRDNVTYVGVHVRRTDFATFLPKEYHVNLVNPKYFHDAMAWFRKKLKGKVLFVVVSDDLEWCKKELVDKADDVVLAAKTVSSRAPSSGHDLAVLASCNHTIIDYGTYGMWGALLAGGYTISLYVDKYGYDMIDQYNKQVSPTDPVWQVWKYK